MFFSEIRSFARQYRQTLRNITWLGLSGILVKPLWIVFITILCARFLGDVGYGIMMTALSLTYLTFSFTSLGIEMYVVREVASDKSRASLFFTNFLVFRLAIYALAACVTVLVAVLLGYTHILLQAVLFASIYKVTLNLTEYSRKFFQVFEVLNYQALSEVLEKFLVIAGGSLLLFTTAAPHWTLMGMAVGMLLTAGWCIWWVANKYVRVRLELFDTGFLLRSLRTLIPFGLVSLFGMIYWRVDTVMIEALMGVASAGHYSLAFRIIEALNMLPIIVAHAAVYPRLSNLSFNGNRKEFRRLTRYVMVGLAVASLPIAAGVFGLAPTLIRWVTSDPSFIPSATVLRYLVVTFPLACLNNTLYVALIALNRQKILATSLGIVSLFNVISNAFLIPLIGINGAAIATVASEALLLIMNLFAYRYGQARLVQRVVDPVVTE